MKMNQIRDLLAAAERGSLRAAARHLGIAQPVITRSIRELERELGITLFERRPRGIVATPMGERFINRVRAAQSELDRAVDEIGQLRGEMQGTLAACLSTAVHISLLPRVIQPFHQRYEGVHLDLSEGLFPDAEPRLKDHLIDVYVGPVPEKLPSSEFVTEKLFDNRRIIVARSGHPLANARSLADLMGAQWITTSTTVKAEEEFGPLFARHGLPMPRVTVQAHSALTMATVVAHSDYLAMLPVQWEDFHWTRASLQKIDVGEELAAPKICIVRGANLPLTPAAEYFCDMLRRASVPYS
ncbi:LysR family transcriptional regulator [Kineobactrum salinum]|uniref:LysR family transcriptional regulator n=1 Tax=Kineobactrum salinum TaxID=2708301 RepID=A0A6C0U449_9GAMM|nr:LysR family transcriptional regulator [Kineobactrum salinum]QIB66912.1 LysR family transcriptional regulator [Kineobactrum salinum]